MTTLLIRRHFVFLLIAAATALGAPEARAASLTVEIVAMPHPPVRAALAPLRGWLAAQGARVSVREIDAESAEGLKRIATAGLSGHIPILILIDGRHIFRRNDGSAVAFVNFPDLPASPPGARGNWLDADVESVVVEHMGQGE